MPFTANKAYSVQTAGSNSGTWGAGNAGNDLNTGVMGILDSNMAGVENLALTSINVTLTSTQAQNLVVRCTGVLLGNVIITTPGLGFYAIDNQCTGNFSITVQYTGAVGGTVIVQQAVVTWVVIDATNGVRATNQYPSLVALNALTGTGIVKKTGTFTFAANAGVTDLAATTANRLYGTDGAGASAVVAPTSPLVLASSALSLPVGATIGRAYAQLAVVTATSSTIPRDNTIPQSSEGAQLMTVSYTPKLTTSVIRIRFRCMASGSSNGATSLIVALFKDSDANAIAATCFDNANLGDPNEPDRIKQLVLEFEHSPATVSSITYKIRFGCNTGFGNMTVNGYSSSTQVFGGASQATLIVEELYAP